VTQVSGTSQQAVPNGSYTVTSTATQTVVITLPANESLIAGDKVTVTGQSGAQWRLAQNARQWVVTTNLPGNVTPGTQWVAREPDPAAPDQRWAGTASSASGNRIAAIASPGGLYLSADGGATWSRSSAPTASWSQVVMSTDGARLAAVADGTLYVSSDYGQNWTARTGTPYITAVHMADNGQRIVAVGGGSLHISTNNGASFTAVPGVAGAGWRSVAGSSTGADLVAVASRWSGSAPGVYVSNDSGATWTQRVTTVEGTDANDWTYAAVSADGMRMVAADNSGYLWVSDDRGATFTRRLGYSPWSGLAISRDGQVIAAQEPRRVGEHPHPGYIFVSRDRGASFPSWYGGDGNGLNLFWQGVSLSYDGNWITAVDNGAPGAGGGKVYTTSGNRTSGGTLGSITGGQNRMVEVTYQGNGRFTVTGQAGGPFSIR